MRNSRLGVAQHLLLLLSVVTLSLGRAAFADDTKTIPQSLLLGFLADNSTFALIDARSPEEFNEAHISGAVNVPVGSVDDFTASLPDDHDQLIVVYCKTGKRAALLQSELEERGYTDVRVLRSNQIVWFDELAVFNCAAPSSQESNGNETAKLIDGLPEVTK